MVAGLKGDQERTKLEDTSMARKRELINTGTDKRYVAQIGLRPPCLNNLRGPAG